MRILRRGSNCFLVVLISLVEWWSALVLCPSTSALYEKSDFGSNIRSAIRGLTIRNIYPVRIRCRIVRRASSCPLLDASNLLVAHLSFVDWITGSGAVIRGTETTRTSDCNWETCTKPSNNPPVYTGAHSDHHLLIYLL